MTIQNSYRGTSPMHSDSGGLRVVAELLSDPSGTSRTAPFIEGCGDGLPDLADGQLIAALQRRREQRVDLEGAGAAGVHRGSPLIGSAVPAFARAVYGELDPGLAAFQ